MAEDAPQSGAGVCDRRVHTERQELRRRGLWLLPWRRSHLCRKDAQWLYAGIERAPVSTIPGARASRLPLRESSGGQEWSVGTRPDRREDEGMPVAEAPVGGAI